MLSQDSVVSQHHHNHHNHSHSHSHDLPNDLWLYIFGFLPLPPHFLPLLASCRRIRRLALLFLSAKLKRSQIELLHPSTASLVARLGQSDSYSSQKLASPHGQSLLEGLLSNLGSPIKRIQCVFKGWDDRRQRWRFEPVLEEMVRFVPVSQPDDHDAGPASSPRRPQQHRRQRVTYLRPIAAPEPMGLSIEPHSDNILAVRVGSVDWTALDRCRNSATSTCLTHYPTHNEGSVAVIDPAVQAKLFWLPLGKVYASNRPAEISANGITIGYRLTSKPVATTTTLASSPSVNGCSPIFLQITDIWCASGSLMTSRMGLHPSAPVSAGGDLASPTSPFSPKLYTSGIRSESFGSLNDQAGFEIMPRRSTLLLVDTSAGTTEPDCSDVCIDARSGSSAYSPRSSVATAYSAFSEASLAVSQPGSRWNPERIECSSWWGTV